MPRRSNTQPDAQWLTERTQRDTTSRTGDDSLGGYQLPSSTASYAAISKTERRHAARNAIRHGLDDNDRDELLAALGLTYDDAAPEPARTHTPEIHDPKPEAEPIPAKECSRCEATKPLTEYFADRRAADGRQSWCKRCNSRASVAAAIQRAQTRTVTEQTCTRCKNTRPAEEFPKDKRSPTGLSLWCRTCRNEANHARHLATRKRRSSARQEVTA